METMEWRDWIALGQLVAFVAVGIYFARRLERLRQLYAKNLKRYDLLHTARFKALEEADDCLVQVQQAQFEAWMALEGTRDPASGSVEKRRLSIAQLRSAVQAATIAKVKCEKFFDAAVNEEFAGLIGKVQTSERCIRDVWELPQYANAAQLKQEKVGKMNEACIASRDAIPAFRKRMGEIIQKDVE